MFNKDDIQRAMHAMRDGFGLEYTPAQMEEMMNKLAVRDPRSVIAHEIWERFLDLDDEKWLTDDDFGFDESASDDDGEAFDDPTS